MKPLISVIPVTKEDEKNADIMELFLNDQFTKHQEVINAITSAREYIKDAYGVTTPDVIWENIIRQTALMLLKAEQ
jgi:hypothetical protein